MDAIENHAVARDEVARDEVSRRAVLGLSAAGVVGALAGCQVYGRPEPAAPPPPEPPASPSPDPDGEADPDDDEPDDDEPDDDEQEQEQEPDDGGGQNEGGNGITLAELADGDGREGRRCLVAVDGVVYEIDGFALWQNGEHLPSGGRAFCGADMSDAIQQSPHGVGKLSSLIELGPLIT